MARSDFKFFYRFRVRFSEVDPQSVVFNSRYLEYADVILGEFWRHHRVAPFSSQEPYTHLRHASVDFIKPLHFDDEVDGFMRISEIRNSSYTAVVELHPKDVEDLHAAIQIVYVHVNRETSKPERIPDWVRELFGHR